MRNSNERGIAMITTLLVLMLISALLVGFTTMVMSDQRFRFIDHDRGAAFYAASGAVEKLTADLGNVFYTNVAPTGVQMNNITLLTSQPVISGITYTGIAPSPLPGSDLSATTCGGTSSLVTKGVNGYTITFCADPSGNPGVLHSATPPYAAISNPIKTGPYEGLVALQTPYQLDVTAKTSTGGEVHLSRTIEAVAIPIFQFGAFDDTDMSFFAESNFSFTGRMHTNGNLWLAEGFGSTLTTSGKITAVKEVVRQYMSNGQTIAAVGMTGALNLASSATTTVPLLVTQGSVVGNLGSALNDPTWSTTVLATYNTWLRNGRTGAKPLNLPVIAVGGTNPDLIKRPLVNEDTTKPLLYGERLFTKASLRILLSDNATDMTNLPSVTPGALNLEGNWNASLPPQVNGVGPTYGTITGNATAPALNHPPLALLPGPITATFSSSTATTVSFSTSAAMAPFRPTFTLAGQPSAVITCTGKTTAVPWQLTGCTGISGWTALGAPIGTVLTQISPAPALGSVGANAPISLAVLNGGATITFASAPPFNPLPFWNPSTSAAPTPSYITCTGWTALTFTGCSGQPSGGTTLSNAVYANAGISPIGGYIKIDRQDADGSWHDVTMEILNYGIGWYNDGGVQCTDPTPNAIIRLQRLRDNGGLAGGGCNYNTDTTGFKDPTNWWPMALFDTREGLQRDNPYPGTTSPNLELGGVMYYVALDAANLAKWFKGTVAPFTTSTGAGVKTDNGGYTVYFSDRRNNRNASSLETGEYGYEDLVNPTSVNGAPNGQLDTGEDVNGNGVLDVYGKFPSYNGTYNSVPPCAACPTSGNPPYPLALSSSVTPRSYISKSAAQVNRPIFFRRALMLMDGLSIAPTISGLTVVSENPVYVHGDWNVPAPVGTTTAANFATVVHAATSVVADSVTLLSNNWSDGNAMDYPYNQSQRNRPANSWYRLAILAGKATSFPMPTDGSATIVEGTDGGVHNFLRMLEGDGNVPGSATVHYRGSTTTFFYSRQGVGDFKCCTNTVTEGIVYSVPIRDFQFDTDFLTPALLPPNTPVFRDMNAVGFSQELRPGK